MRLQELPSWAFLGVMWTLALPLFSFASFRQRAGGCRRCEAVVYPKPTFCTLAHCFSTSECPRDRDNPGWGWARAGGHPRNTGEKRARRRCPHQVVFKLPAIVLTHHSAPSIARALPWAALAWAHQRMHVTPYLHLPRDTHDRKC